jgi:hypothetical protein
MGCSSSRQEDILHPSTGERVTRDELKSEGAGEPLWGEVELVVAAPTGSKTGGGTLETFHDFSIWMPGTPLPPDAPGPPPLPSGEGDEAASQLLATPKFLLKALDMADTAAEWASPSKPTTVWIRLMAGQQDRVSADAVFLINGRLKSPYDVHRETAKQKELLGALYAKWLAYLLFGPTGSRRPGDIVLKCAVAGQDRKIEPVGVDWEPHTYFGYGKRDPWMASLRASEAHQLSQAPSTTLFLNRSDKYTLSPQEEASQSAFLERFQSFFPTLVAEALNWPPQYLGMVDFFLLHPPGLEPLSRVMIMTAAGDDLADYRSRLGQHPSVLMDSVQSQWDSLCREGAVGVHHPVSLGISARLPIAPSGEKGELVLSVTPSWSEDAYVATMTRPLREVYSIFREQNEAVRASDPPH